ncbi:hypothetical protein SFRURICE_017223, partial [Spodoptera frugiperda]
KELLGKVSLGLFRFFENFSVVARSLQLCPVNGNRFIPVFDGSYNTNGEKWVYIYLTMAQTALQRLYTVLFAVFSIVIVAISCCCKKKIPCSGRAPCRRGPYRH